MIEELEKLRDSWERCLLTEGEYTNKQIIEAQKAALTRHYEELNELIIKLKANFIKNV